MWRKGRFSPGDAVSADRRWPVGKRDVLMPRESFIVHALSMGSGLFSTRPLRSELQRTNAINGRLLILNLFF